jgi:hypothetical protein
MGKPVPGSDAIDKEVGDWVKSTLKLFFGGTTAIVRTKVFMNTDEKKLRDISLISGILSTHADNYLSIRVEQKLGGHIGGTTITGESLGQIKVKIAPKIKVKAKAKPKAKPSKAVVPVREIAT